MLLSTATLTQLDAPVMTVPYDREALQAGIVHVGVGNFHRAHMAVYLDELLRSSPDSSSNMNNKNKINNNNNNNMWGLVGAGVMPDHKDTANVLQNQDCLWTVVTRNADSTQPQIVGSMMDCLDYSENHDELKDELLQPNIKIVSLTVTEGGYFLHDGQFDPTHPKILHDAQHPESPQTVFGVMVQALRERRQAGIAPFTIMSCDNVPHNGAICKVATLGLAHMQDPELAAWMQDHVTFPNSMVDRITPATTAAEKESGTQSAYGYSDHWPVYCEPFKQWVLEDSFCNGRPALEAVGVQFVPDVTPYERAKIRILNGGHASLCYPAALLGLDFVHEAMEHDVIREFLDTVERTEIVPGVPAVPDTDLPAYWETIQRRFANPTIRDSIARNCYDGASRQPKFILPPIQDNLASSRSVRGLAMVSALWCRYCVGTTERGEPIASNNDPSWDRLQSIALQAQTDPQQWLALNKDVYGKVSENPVFSNAFAHAVKSIQDLGVEGAMKEYIRTAI